MSADCHSHARLIDGYLRWGGGARGAGAVGCCATRGPTGPAPVKADENGQFPVPIPGRWTEV